jgi:hypothetical protein
MPLNSMEKDGAAIYPFKFYIYKDGAAGFPVKSSIKRWHCDFPY